MNPNEYDEEAFVKASNEFQGNATEMINALWEAGADATDIVAEINTALENSNAFNSADGTIELEEID